MVTWEVENFLKNMLGEYLSALDYKGEYFLDRFVRKGILEQNESITASMANPRF